MKSTTLQEIVSEPETQVNFVAHVYQFGMKNAFY
jgi:hypothetical protein